MDTRIYVMTHKQIEPIENDIYIPLHVGRKGKEDLGYQGDDTGASISEKNDRYCELTGLYWLWKNVSCDIVGICHYRRFFVKEEQILEKEYIEEILQQYDMIIPDSRCSEEGSMGKHYAARHEIEDLLLCGEIIKEKCPEYTVAFQVAMKANLISMGNMWITRKEIFDVYCTWLFDILFEAEKRIDFTKYDAYQGRAMGFLSERLFRVWLLRQEYSVREEYVKMIETKNFLNGIKDMQLKYQYVKATLKPLLQIYNSYSDSIDAVKSLAEDFYQKDDFEGKIPVWVCWWQGADTAPELVKICIDSIQKHIPKEKAVLRLITLENCMEYVTFTDAIIKKFQEGKITLTHLSDILHAELLYRYGGMWIDAAYYVGRDMDRRIFEKDMFWTLKYPDSTWKSDISAGRWSGSLIRISPKSLLARFLMESFWYYWEVNDSLIDYFLIDYVVAVAYDIFPEVRRMVDECSESDTAVFELQKNLNRSFDEKKYREWTQKTSFFKLDWRTEVTEMTLTQKKTFWGYLKENVESYKEFSVQK